MPAFKLLQLLLGLSFLVSLTKTEKTEQDAKASNDSLLWGPYRPNLYFGVRPRIPKSFSANLQWAHVGDFQAVQHSASPLLPCGVRSTNVSQVSDGRASRQRL